MLTGSFHVLAGSIGAQLSAYSEDAATFVEKVGCYAAVVDDRVGTAGKLAALLTPPLMSTDT